MKKLFLVSALVLVFSGFLCHEAFVFSAWAAAPPPTTIRFKGGCCEIYAILDGAPIAPTGMKENEAALALRFKYVLNKGVATDALGVELYEKGRL
jgi:hypothetical protein